MSLLAKLAGTPYNNRQESNCDINVIIANLNNILGTKRGYGFFLEKFGLSDYKHISSHEYVVDLLSSEIKENIELFEPRVKVKKIINTTDISLTLLSFQLDFEVAKHSYSYKVYLDSVSKSFQVQS
jgi:predicted component of type VI protein secretion system